VLSSVTVEGALATRTTETGVSFGRLPAWTDAQIVDPGLALVVGMPAGVRLSLHTDARRLELDALQTLIKIGDFALPAVFELVVDGVSRSRQTSDVGVHILVDPDTRAIEYRPGESITLVFDDLPGDSAARIEVWLPHAASVEIQGLRVPDGTSITPATAKGRTWVHYGSSISQCVEATTPSRAWAITAALRAGLSPLSLGFAGQCLLDPLVARTIRDLDAEVISAEIGINVVNHDAMRERVFVPALHGFLDTVRDGHPRTPLVIVSPIICPVAEDHPGPTMDDGGTVVVFPRPPELSVGSLTLSRTRELVAEVVAKRREAGDSNLHLVDGLSLFGPADLADLPDGLHPNDAGYQRMAERFLVQVTPLLDQR
jgi:hypothetical protein